METSFFRMLIYPAVLKVRDDLIIAASGHFIQQFRCD